MSMLSWNCRGLGSLSAVLDLKYLVRHYNPEFLFLSETFVHNDDILSLRNFVTFWSSQGNLSSKKGRKTEENAKS